MINPRRLKTVLDKIAEKLFPHEPSCNLVRRDSNGYGMGCTCDSGEKARLLKEEINQLEKEDLEEDEHSWSGMF